MGATVQLGAIRRLAPQRYWPMPSASTIRDRDTLRALDWAASLPEVEPRDRTSAPGAALRLRLSKPSTARGTRESARGGSA